MKVSYEWLQNFFDVPLPSPAALGEKITFGAFEIESIDEQDGDTVLDIKVLPDRAHDALSHRGIAHEISVLTEVPMNHDPLHEGIPQLLPHAEGFSVVVDDPKTTPFYGAALMQGVTVGPSPAWLTKRLEMIGQRSINNVVDATNYVMFELGSPLHAFDAKKFTSNGRVGIRVRPAYSGEIITTLGGTEYGLSEEMTVIADLHSDRALAIGGVKGGVLAEVDETTTDIVLEAAMFNPIRTRRTSQALKLRTDASHRFENGMATTLPLYGLTAVVKLISEIAEGELVGYAHSEIPTQYPFVLGVSVDEVNRRLGTDLSEATITSVLTRLGMEATVVDPIEHVLEEAPKHVGVPYKRGASVLRDAPNAFDCSAFTAWLFAHAGIALPRISIDQFVYGEEIEHEALVPGDLIFANTNEIISTTGEYYSQVLDVMVREEPIRTETLEYLPGTKVEQGVDHVGVYLGDNKVIHTSAKIGHVVIEDLATSAQFQNIVGYRRIAKRGEKRLVVVVPFERLDIRQPADLIEEIGRVYGYEHVPALSPDASVAPVALNPTFYWSEAIRSALDAAGFSEIMTYSLRESGEERLLNPLAADKGFLRADLRSAMHEAIDKNEYNLPLVGETEVRLYEIGHIFKKGSESIHVAVGARASAGTKRDERTADILSAARSAIVDTLGVSEAALNSEADGEVFECNLSAILPQLSIMDTYPANPRVAPSVLYTPLSTYPFMLRDVALWVPQGTMSDEIEQMIRTYAGELLVRLDLFDQFEKEDRTSYAFHLVFQSNERTLSDTEVGAIMESITTAVTSAGWEIR